MSVRIETASEPFDEPDVALPAIAALERAEAMGLVTGDIRHLDVRALRAALAQLSQHGVAVGLQPLLGDQIDRERARMIVARLEEALEGSPAPTEEARSLGRVLETELLARLVGVSPVTVNRWIRAERAPSYVHAERLHWLSAVVADLRTAYNAFGVRRWFLRPRAQLDGQSPANELGRDWDPDGDSARRVRELASWLTSPSAT